MSRKQHVVRLSRDDRRDLNRLVRTGHRSAWSLQRARILLLADASAEGSAHTDASIAENLGVSTRTVARVRAAWGDQGLGCLTRTPQARPSRTPTFSDGQLLELAAVACTDPPPGFARWSLRMLTDRVIELEIVPTACPETVRKALKKTISNPGDLSAL